MGKCFTVIVAAAAAALSFSGASHAAEYPTRPVRIVMGFSAGGPTDAAGAYVNSDPRFVPSFNASTGAPVASSYQRHAGDDEHPPTRPHGLSPRQSPGSKVNPTSDSSQGSLPLPSKSMISVFR